MTKEYKEVIDFFLNRYREGFILDNNEYTFGEILDYLLTKLAESENERDALQEWKKHLFETLDNKLFKVKKTDTEHDKKSYIAYNSVLLSIVSSIDAYKSIEMNSRKDIYK